MGTRADFWIGQPGQGNMDWVGSVAYSGYPAHIMIHLFFEDEVESVEEGTDFLELVRAYCTTCETATLPEMGWPWPWQDGNITDYSYVFDTQRKQIVIVWNRRVYNPWDGNNRRRWFSGLEGPEGPSEYDLWHTSERKDVTMGPRSGLMAIPSELREDELERHHRDSKIRYEAYKQIVGELDKVDGSPEGQVVLGGAMGFVWGEANAEDKPISQ